MPIFSRFALRSSCAVPVALLAMAAPAFAEPQTETVITATSHAAGTVTRSTRVAYGDLNLADVRDQHQLSRRVREAADAVCATGQDELWTKYQGTDYRRCVEQAVASAASGIPGGAIAARD